MGNRTGTTRRSGKRIVSGGSSADDARERDHDAALFHAASRVVKKRRVVDESRRERARALMADDGIAEVHVREHRVAVLQGRPQRPCVLGAAAVVVAEVQGLKKRPRRVVDESRLLRELASNSADRRTANIYLVLRRRERARARPPGRRHVSQRPVFRTHDGLAGLLAKNRKVSRWWRRCGRGPAASAGQPRRPLRALAACGRASAALRDAPPRRARHAALGPGAGAAPRRRRDARQATIKERAERAERAGWPRWGARQGRRGAGAAASAPPRARRAPRAPVRLVALGRARARPRTVACWSG